MPISGKESSSALTFLGGTDYYYHDTSEREVLLSHFSLESWHQVDLKVFECEFCGEKETEEIGLNQAFGIKYARQD